MKFNFSFHLALSALAMMVAPAVGQTLDPTRQAEGVRPFLGNRAVTEQSPDASGLEDQNEFAPESPGDDDIGQQLILKDSEKERWLVGQFDTFAFFTDNPANLSDGGEDDVFWASQISVGAQPRLADRLYLDTFVSQQVYRYDKFDLLDYEYFQASMGVVYLEPRLWDSILFSQIQYGRTTSDNFGQDVLNSYSLLAGIQKTLVIDRQNSIYMNFMGDWDLDSDVNELEHAEYIADLSYRYKIMRDLVLSASYRFTWFDYYNVDRNDALNLMGLYLNWSPRKWINLYVGGVYNINNSNVDVFDYNANNLGGGLGLQIRF